MVVAVQTNPLPGRLSFGSLTVDPSPSRRYFNFPR